MAITGTDDRDGMDMADKCGTDDNEMEQLDMADKSSHDDNEMEEPSQLVAEPGTSALPASSQDMGNQLVLAHR